MNFENTALYRAIIMAKQKNVYLIRLGGLDSIHLRTIEGNPQMRLLRTTTNRFTGTHTLTLFLAEGERFAIHRTVYGLQAITMGNASTIEVKHYMVVVGNVCTITEPDIHDYHQIDINKPQQLVAVDKLLSDVLGTANMVLENHNTHIDQIRLEDRLRLNQGSQYGSVVYEISGPGKARALSIDELHALRIKYEPVEMCVPEGVVYLKVPTTVREMVLCGHPNTLEKYRVAFGTSQSYKLHRLDDGKTKDGSALENARVDSEVYAILPNAVL